MKQRPASLGGRRRALRALGLSVACVLALAGLPALFGAPAGRDAGRSPGLSALLPAVAHAEPGHQSAQRGGLQELWKRYPLGRESSSPGNRGSSRSAAGSGPVLRILPTPSPAAADGPNWILLAALIALGALAAFIGVRALGRSRRLVPQPALHAPGLGVLHLRGRRREIAVPPVGEAPSRAHDDGRARAEEERLRSEGEARARAEEERLRAEEDARAEEATAARHGATASRRWRRSSSSPLTSRAFRVAPLPSSAELRAAQRRSKRSARAKRLSLLVLVLVAAACVGVAFAVLVSTGLTATVVVP